jgi:hypothetical protein
MSDITTPDYLEFEDIHMNGPWQEALPPRDHPTFQSFVSISYDEIPQFIIITKTQKITLNFGIAKQIFLDGVKFRYNKNDVTSMKIEDV